MFNNTTDNFTNQTSVVLFDRSAYRVSIEIWFGVSSSISIFGGISNLLLFLTICSNTSLRTGSGILIAHLLFIEFVICAVVIPISNITLYLRSSSFFVCKNLQFATNVFLSTGYWSTFCLSVNRFVAIVVPSVYKISTSKYVLVSMMTSAWLIGVILNLLNFLTVSGTYTNLGGIWPGCSLRPIWTIGGIPINVVIGMYIPMGFVGILYVVIFAYTLFLRCGLFIAGNITDNSRRLAVARMLFFSFLLYCACYLPLVILQRPFRNDVPFKQLPLGMLAWWLGTIYLTGYAINPVLLLLLSKEYQHKLARRLGLCGRQNAVDQMSDASEQPARRGVRIQRQLRLTANTVIISAPTQQ